MVMNKKSYRKCSPALPSLQEIAHFCSSFRLFDFWQMRVTQRAAVRLTKVVSGDDKC